MSWYLNRSITTKLMLAFLLTSGLMAGIGYLGAAGTARTSDTIKTLMERDLASRGAAREAATAFARLGRVVRHTVLVKAPADKQRFAAQVDEQTVAFLTFLEKMEETSSTDEDRAALAAVKRDFTEYQRGAKEAVRLTIAQKNDEAIGAIDALATWTKNVDASLSVFINAKSASAEQATARTMENAAGTRSTIILATIGVSVLAVFLGWFTARLVARPLNRTMLVLQSVAAGDLSQRVEVESTDEVRKMAEALNAALDKMGSAMREVRASSGAVAEASTQLAAASEEISSGAQEQASSLEECASSLEEMTSAVRQNADNAQQARQLAEGARDAAEKGGKVVTQAVTAMSGINQSSKRIADIITTIDEIAFQTNLLALNAAVEAARAGDQGRGFAVVAAEVRSLAQRAAASAKEIKGLIQDSLRKVEGGSELVNQSGQSLAEIVSAVKRAADIVTEIAAASKEQAAGVEQVSKAVAQMDQVTQANAAQTEELSGTAQGLTGQADQLRGLVARFKLDDGSADEPARPAAPAPRPAKPVARPAAKPSKPVKAVKPARPVPSLDLVGVSANGHHAAHGNEDGFVEM
ncbi:methyl-accepting chemotaxis protein [Frigoriglobus tundricola]|uniref:Methyl-accepting chemotaxis protein I (Serine chemoreceptor protein) n=1 Tax=Frigoriglobus tundricola TaxID=2774151 RepID=A0A6M5YYS7_9BACT|nr:methyl-accepting chemotaxis protein [Frigoriglobus tundricola]QJW99287.1 Methyl-accepting chemotaxis protein I (serine chemoreceptor protein) [Frigoriglobus tundricola]